MIRQPSIFAENRKGAMQRVTQALAARRGLAVPVNEEPYRTVLAMEAKY